MTPVERNLADLQQELDWLEQVVQGQLETYLAAEKERRDILAWPPPPLEPGASVLARLVHDWQLEAPERLALGLALAPHLRPQALDMLMLESSQTGRVLTEVGGTVDTRHRGFLPNGQTLAFLLSANQPDAWRDYVRITAPEHRLMREQVLRLKSAGEHSPRIACQLLLSEQWLHYLLTGEAARPERESDFPARPISCAQEWADLVLEQSVMEQLLEIRHWLQYGEQLMNDYGLQGKIKPGYRALFYGPPGTGKTLSACLLGKSMGREVYRVDASMVVSKYIGETEKNLGRMFDAAQYRDWILFFDEADSLFGKRTAAATSNDRHANQQTAYLLQRIEDFPGVVILATNLRANMDEAFTRRFQAMVQFAMPGAQERARLWQAAFGGSLEFGSDVDPAELADRFELSGGAIINVLRACALSAAAAGKRTVTSELLFHALRRELAKDSKSLQLKRGTS